MKPIKVLNYLDFESFYNYRLCKRIKSFINDFMYVYFDRIVLEYKSTNKNTIYNTNNGGDLRTKRSRNFYQLKLMFEILLYYKI